MLKYAILNLLIKYKAIFIKETFSAITNGVNTTPESPLFNFTFYSTTDIVNYHRLVSGCTSLFSFVVWATALSLLRGDCLDIHLSKVLFFSLIRAHIRRSQNPRCSPLVVTTDNGWIDTESSVINQTSLIIYCEHAC